MNEVYNRRYLYGTIKAGDRGQVMGPFHERDHFNSKLGHLVLMVGGRRREGIDSVHTEAEKEVVLKLLKGLEELVNDQEKYEVVN